VPGERIIALMTAGNLATTQAVISQLEERTKAPVERQNSLLEGADDVPGRHRDRAAAARDGEDRRPSTAMTARAASPPP
jgi:predicted proteasome-type protease